MGFCLVAFASWAGAVEVIRKQQEGFGYFKP
jgi:hypothetical protein